MYAKFRCSPLRIKKALDIFRELVPTTTTTTTTRVALWGRLLGPKITGCYYIKITKIFTVLTQWHH